MLNTVFENPKSPNKILSSLKTFFSFFFNPFTHQSIFCMCFKLFKYIKFYYKLLRWTNYSSEKNLILDNSSIGKYFIRRKVRDSRSVVMEMLFFHVLIPFFFKLRLLLKYLKQKNCLYIFLNLKHIFRSNLDANCTINSKSPPPLPGFLYVSCV